MERLAAVGTRLVLVADPALPVAGLAATDAATWSEALARHAREQGAVVRVEVTQAAPGARSALTSLLRDRE